MNLRFLAPLTNWLLSQPRNSMVDIAIAVALTALALSQKFWLRYVPISENIPDHFWLQVPQQSSGHLALLKTRAESRNIKHVFSEFGLDMVVFWGSQSGRAEMLARRLAMSLHDRFKFKVLAADLDDYDHVHLTKLEKHQLCGFVLSTYGDGDPPDNTNALWNTLHQLQADNASLDNLRYLIFGLGNSNYRQYNRVAEHVDTLLQSMSAVRIGLASRGDDANGETEDHFSLWRQTCEEQLKAELQLSEESSTYQPSFNVQYDTSGSKQVNLGDANDANDGKPSRSQQAFIRPLPINRIYKLWEDNARVCLHVDLDLSQDRMVKYKTGDHLAIWPSNPDNEVHRLISLLKLEAEQHTPISIEPARGGIPGGKMPVASPTTIHALFRYYLEICAAMSQETVADLELFALSDTARSEIRRITGNPEVFKAQVTANHATLADILEAVGNGKYWDIPISFLLERLKPMKPRYYSISSSTIVQPQSISLTAVATKPPQVGNSPDSLSIGCYGLATSYLGCLEEAINGGMKTDGTSYPPAFTLAGPRGVLKGGKLFGQIRQSTFKLPVKAWTPVIMLGAGTGVAPFRGFVQERVRRKELGEKVGSTLLFMGFRHPDVDFIYKHDWEKWRVALGYDVFKFWTAFSRESDNRKIYIQDRLKDNSSEVMGLLSGDLGCQLYICGSGAMAKDVVRALVGMKMELSGVDEEQAISWIKYLRQSKLLLEDVWG